MDRKKMEKFIQPLNMGKLQGRMLSMRSSRAKAKSTEILFIYGHHASLERVFGFAEVLSRYGNVTMPDIPGFGGMDSFYKIGQTPNVDAYSDYLAAFIKLRYKRKKAIIIGYSYSIPVIVRTLQKYPELSKRVHFIGSVAGFVHKDDFKISPVYIFLLKTMSILGSTWLISNLLKYTVINPIGLRFGYMIGGRFNPKTKHQDKKIRAEILDFELELWQKNDLRTWFKTIGEMFSLNLCEEQNRLKIPMHHAVPKNDIYLDEAVVEQHMQVIFEDFHIHKTVMELHAPSIMASAKEVESYFPKSFIKALKSVE